jgi:hypothetical protein
MGWKTGQSLRNSQKGQEIFLLSKFSFSGLSSHFSYFKAEPLPPSCTEE